jgi:hypothetical protein
MHSFSRRASVRRILQLLLIAALVILSRAPFLLRGERFFDSDEAVEGLMARHVLDGEFPVFVWGQRYKGVPEIYLTAAVFAVAGSSVIALKSVTLACYAVFVCLQFVLVTRLFSRGIAWLATAFLIAGPPSLVFWSLSASAEVVMTMLAGTAMCLGVDVWRRTGSRTAFAAAAVSAGFGLWVHQYILYYWIALGMAVWHWLPQRHRILRDLLANREGPGWLRLTIGLLAVVGGAYAVLGVLAFVTGGGDVMIFGTSVGIRNAQKLWYIAVGLAVFAAGLRVSLLARHANRESAWLVYTAAVGFVIGYAPALVARAMAGGAPPIGRSDLAGVATAVSPMVRDVVPIVLGFKGPDTSWLGIPAWMGFGLALIVGASLRALRDRPFTPLFHYLLFTTPLVFLMSGAFVDAQSYRYLMPIWGALAVVLAVGVWWIFQRSRVAGGVALVATVAMFGLQQRAWYSQLAPDVQSRALIACLEGAGVRLASADYWVSYKLTFLANERLIVAPEGGIDRYPAYTAQVRAHPGAPSIPDKMMGLPCIPDPSSFR